ncbi:MAG TPA: AAA family ATPase [Jatrophihabitans sp.]|nr:AAA family ATPase [Jatrophihabitans sp.]
MLHGRSRERERIALLRDEAWAGRGGALVLRGQPGVGKSALLRDAIEGAEGMQVLKTEGIESEAPLAFAALQRLLRPAMRHAGQLPAPQAKALRAAFGEDTEQAPDRFLVFLAALSLLAEAAELAPVLCVIDDAHWLDDASAAALTFVARRLGPERVAMLFGAREGDLRSFDSAGLPEWEVGGLDPAAAADLLSERAGVTVAVEVLDRLMAQTGGNPLGLVELPGVLSAAQLGGEHQLPPDLPLTEGVQRIFLDRSRRLSADAQTLLLVAAADDSARLAVVARAAELLGIGTAALNEVERSQLLKVAGTVLHLRHPLVRSAIYQGSTSLSRRQAHRALAAVLTGGDDADRRAWHLAAAAEEPDDTVVAELDSAAGRAQRRGGYEAASAALERAAELTRDDEGRAQRLLDAATNSWLAGQFGRARTLAGNARPLTAAPTVRADIDKLRGRIELNVGSVPAAIRVWTQATREVAPADRQRARELAMIASAGSTFLAAPDRTDLDPSEVLEDLDDAAPARQRCFASLLTGFSHLLAGDLSRAAPVLRDALTAGEHLLETDLLSNLGIAAFHLGADEEFRRSFARLLAQSRDSGAVGLVLFALPRLALAHLSASQWNAAVSDAAEALNLARGIGQPALTAMPLAELTLFAALRAEDAYDSRLADLETVMAAQPAGILAVLVADIARWAQGIHDARTGQPASAVRHLEQLTQPPLARLAAYDRLEAAVRAGEVDKATGWLAELEQFADAVGSARALGVVCFGRALLADADTAETHFRQALRYQASSGRPFELARGQLGYGEFLRRARRRVDAREHLRAALATFDDLGAQGWAERARQELRASGETARKRDASSTATLTAQETQVAALVASGLSNRDVAAQLFLSPRTIDFHLRNVFAKTGVSSRGELVRLDLG